jgi:ubiquinone/menaquinone biosynthesis C-methylase UbiE
MAETIELVKGSDKWGSFYGAGKGNVYPDESLVRLIRGKYADIPKSGRVVDVGFGIGANMVLFAQSGFDVHGMEVSQPSLDAASELAKKAGVSFSLKLITGTEMPYPDNHFDIVLSWAAVYYHGSRTKVQAAIDDFHRVIRPGGVLLMAVPHPNSHWPRRLSDDIGDGTHKVDRQSPYDLRYGLEIFYEPSSSGWRTLMKKFSSIDEGYSEEDLFNSERRDARRFFLARK